MILTIMNDFFWYLLFARIIGNEKKRQVKVII